MKFFLRFTHIYTCCVFSEWALGPDEEILKASSEAGDEGSTHMPPVLTHSHPNAFHVWDQDDVVIPLSLNHSPQASPLLAAIPFIPHFFPSPHSVLNSPALPQTHPGENKSPTKTPHEAYIFPWPKIRGHSSTLSHVSFHKRRDGTDKVWTTEQWLTLDCSLRPIQS